MKWLYLEVQQLFEWDLLKISKTISSIISDNSNFQVYNMGLELITIFQELTLFNQIYNKFKNLKHLIFVSGFNDIFVQLYRKQKL